MLHNLEPGVKKYQPFMGFCITFTQEQCSSKLVAIVIIDGYNVLYYSKSLKSRSLFQYQLPEWFYKHNVEAEGRHLAHVRHLICRLAAPRLRVHADLRSVRSLQEIIVNL